MIPQPLMAIKRLGKNVLILSVCQALGLSGVPLVLLLGGIIGSELAPSEKWATLPIAIVVIGIALFSIPAAMVMKWIGRKRGFIISSAVGSAATLGAAFAISVQSFSLFCFMVLFIGGSTAFIAQYRFAAAESVEQKYSARAVSFVLIGGIVAGFLGPEIGRDGKDWLGFGDYTGSFVAMALMFALSGVLLLFISEKAVKKESVMEQERPLKAVVSQRTFLVAAISSAIAFGAMGFIMSATPLSMHVIDRFSLNSTTIVIQSHIIGMYLPSLFSGFLVERLGVKTLQILGVAGMCVAAVAAAASHQFVFYLVALTFLGIGWNFLFVAGTVMLTHSYRSVERFKAQGINDFAVFTFQALAILSAGLVLSAAGWEVLNLVTIPFLLITLVMVITTRSAAKKQTGF